MHILFRLFVQCGFTTLSLHSIICPAYLLTHKTAGMLKFKTNFLITKQNTQNILLKQTILTQISK